EWLLEAVVVTFALFRPQIQIGEEVERREADIELIECRRLEAGAVGSFELGFKPWDDDSGCKAKRRGRSEGVIVIEARVGDEEEALSEIGLRFDVTGLGRR